MKENKKENLLKKFYYYKNLTINNNKIISSLERFIKKNKNAKYEGPKNTIIINLLHQKLTDINARIKKIKNNNNILKKYLLLLSKNSRAIIKKDGNFISKCLIAKNINIERQKYTKYKKLNEPVCLEDKSDLLLFLYNYYHIEDNTNLNNLF